MDGMRTQARDRFEKEQSFKVDKELYTRKVPFITIAKYATNVHVDESGVPWISNSLCKKLTETVAKHNSETASAVFKLVKFDRVISGELWIDRQTFINAFEEIGFDPYWLHLIQNCVYGFFMRQIPDSTLQTFYLHTVNYTLIWAYDLRAGIPTTKAIMMPRLSTKPRPTHHRFHSYTHHPTGFSSFVDAMKANKHYINDARFCSLVSLTELINWNETSQAEYLVTIRDIEAQTEHGPWHIAAKERNTSSTDQLMDSSRVAGIILAKLANLVRHTPIAKDLVESLSSVRASSAPLLHPGYSSSETTINESSNVPAPTASNDDFLLAQEFLRRQVVSGELQAEYLQERARTQHSVIFNMLTRQDAQNSANVARAARKDSHSMKTIAVMTMVFLPPTFFATLFSMPLLRWDKERVMSEHFGIYCAFSLPVTFLVFVAWYVMDKKEGDRVFSVGFRRLIAPKKRGNSDEGDSKAGEELRNIPRRPKVIKDIRHSI